MIIKTFGEICKVVNNSLHTIGMSKTLRDKSQLNQQKVE